MSAAKFQYPMELDPGQTDFVMFTASEYRTNKKVTGSKVSGPGAGPSSSTIVLYMPTTTPAVSQQANWQAKRFDGEFGAIVRDLAATGANMMQNAQIPGSFEQGIQEGKAAFESLKKEVMSRANSGKLEAAGRQLGVNAIASIAQMSPNQLMAMSTGKIYNPNVELLYEGPKLRNFNFTFQFVPKSPAEAQMVNQIIMEFKKWSSPKEDGSGMYEVPHVWQVAYMTNGSENTNMNAFKRAACTGVTVQNNQGMNMHMSFDDGMPIITTMTLGFQEVDVITRNDHEKVKGVGY